MGDKALLLPSYCGCFSAIGQDYSLKNETCLTPKPAPSHLVRGFQTVSKRFAEAWNFGPLPHSIYPVGKLVEAFFHYFRENTGIRTQAQWHDTSMPGQAHEAGLLLLDIGKAMQHLGWKPALDFRETVAFTADWYTRYANSDVLRLCQEQIESYHKTWKYRMDA